MGTQKICGAGVSEKGHAMGPTDICPFPTPDLPCLILALWIAVLYIWIFFQHYLVDVGSFIEEFFWTF